MESVTADGAFENQPTPPPPPQTAVATDSSGPQGQPHRFEFSGQAGEFFRIWIVNIALSLLTLGIYSAWAKVRTKRYFYGSTSLAGSSLDWDANPIAILKGRIIAVTLLLILHVAGSFYPLALIALYLLLLPALPWIMIRSMGFNLRHSIYRNVRFGFDGKYWEAFKVYLLWGLAIIASFGLAMPYVMHRQRRFITDRSRFGTTNFKFDGEIGFFYVVYIIAYLVQLGLIVVVAVMAGGLTLLGIEGGASVENEGPPVGFIIAMVLGYVVMIALFTLITVAITTLIANHSWSRTQLGQVRFNLDLKVGKMLWLQLSNLFLIIVSLGLFIPWAKIRTTRYVLSRYTVFADSLDKYVAAEAENVSAIGSEIGDVFDLDISI